MKDEVHLQQGEELLATIREGGIRPFFRIAIGFCLFLLPFFFFFSFLALDYFGLVAMSIFAGIGYFYTWHSWNKWWYSVILVTNQRLVSCFQKNFFQYSFESIDFSSIKNIKTKKVSKSFFGLGDIRIEVSKEGSGYFYFRRIRRVKDVAEFLQDVKSFYNTTSHQDYE